MKGGNMKYFDFVMGVFQFLSLWLVCLIFIRMIHRYGQKYTSEKTWKKDIIISLIQCIVIIFTLVLLSRFMQS